MTEFRPGSFQILPTIIKNLIIINVLVFLAQITLERSLAPGYLENTFALHTWQSPFFKPWQFVTYLFMHGGWDHLFGNMFALWMFGSILENLWGPRRFLLFYMVCGLGAALAHMTALYFETQHYIETQNFFELQKVLITPTLGASGSVFGCLIAFGYLFPNTYIYLYFFLPLKAKWFVLFYAGGELLLAIQNSAGDNVAHFAHLGGALVGLILVYYWNKNNRRNFY